MFNFSSFLVYAFLMLARICSYAVIVEVGMGYSNGLPAVVIVGLFDAAG